MSNELRPGLSCSDGLVTPLRGHENLLSIFLLTRIDLDVGENLTRSDIVEPLEVQTNVFHKLAEIQTFDDFRRLLKQNLVMNEFRNE